eukprot:Tbor_TRINITY_DN3531_c0_g1::TRINITY_DN3531_c0_g1_i1::g.2810::m.2810
MMKRLIALESELQFTIKERNSIMENEERRRKDEAMTREIDQIKNREVLEQQQILLDKEGEIQGLLDRVEELKMTINSGHILHFGALEDLETVCRSRLENCATLLIDPLCGIFDSFLKVQGGSYSQDILEQCSDPCQETEGCIRRELIMHCGENHVTQMRGGCEEPQKGLCNVEEKMASLSSQMMLIVYVHDEEKGRLLIQLHYLMELLEIEHGTTHNILKGEITVLKGELRHLCETEGQEIDGVITLLEEEKTSDKGLENEFKESNSKLKDDRQVIKNENASLEEEQQIIKWNERFETKTMWDEQIEKQKEQEYTIVKLKTTLEEDEKAINEKARENSVANTALQQVEKELSLER